MTGNYETIYNTLQLNLYRFGIILMYLTIILTTVLFIVFLFSKNRNKRLKGIITFILSLIPAIAGGIFGINPLTPLDYLQTPIINEVSQENEGITSENFDEVPTSLNDISQNQHVNTNENKIDYENVIDYSNLEIVIVIDKSSSMGDYSDKDYVALDAAKSFVDLCKNAGNCKVSLVSFANNSEIVFENKSAKTDNDYIKAEINSIKYDSAFTNIVNALEDANNIIKKSDNPYSKKMILLISDGKIDVPRYSKKSSKDLENEIYSKLNNDYYNCPIYTIALDGKNEKYPTDTKLLRKIAEQTGGDEHIITVDEGLNNVSNDGENLYSYLIKIIRKYLGIKASETNISIKLDSKNTYQINSDIIPYSQGCSVLIYGNTTNVNLQADSSEILKGNNYIIVSFDNSDKKTQKCILSSQSESEIKYAFIYNFDISLEYAINETIYVGQPLCLSAKLISNIKIDDQDVIPYLYIYTKDERFSGREPSYEIMLEKNDGSYILEEELVFSTVSEYYCKFVLKSKDNNFERSSEFNRINVIEPKVKILSAHNKSKNKLNIVAGFSFDDSLVSNISKIDFLNNFDIYFSTDGINFEKSTLTNSTFQSEIDFENSGEEFDLYIKVELKNLTKKLYDNVFSPNITLLKNVKLQNASPYLMGENIIEKVSSFRMFNDNKITLNLNQYFGDDSSEFDINVESESIGTKYTLYDDKILEVESNLFGINKLVIYAIDKKDTSLISEPLTVSFSIKWYIGELFIVLIMSIFTFLSVIIIYVKRTYDDIQLNIKVDNGITIHPIFKGKTVKVSKLLNNEDKKYFKHFKLKRLNRNSSVVKLIDSKDKNSTQTFSLNEVFCIIGTCERTLKITGGIDNI